eukprot:135683-Hanusia_phi.AAC.1
MGDMPGINNSLIIIKYIAAAVHGPPIGWAWSRRQHNRRSPSTPLSIPRSLEALDAKGPPQRRSGMAVLRRRFMAILSSTGF